jgi:uncharacterized protein (TIGR03437 family)
MKIRAAIALLLSSYSLAAEFRTGQAARAVLGQSSFSSRETGVNAISLVIAGDRLYAADRSGRTLTFDLSGIGDAHADRAVQRGTSCSVCIGTPIAAIRHPVMPGVAAVSTWGKTVAVADTAHHRVLIWRDATAPKLDRGPDVILGRSEDFRTGAATLLEPVSVALDERHLFVGDAGLHRVLVWNALPLTDNQAADEVLGQRDFSATAVAPSPTADSIGIPAAMASDGYDLFVADAAANRILVFSPSEKTLTREGIVNAATIRAAPIAPGTLLSITGEKLTAETESAPTDSDTQLPTQLGGVEVILDGIALPLAFVSPGEVEALVPVDLLARTASSVYLRLEHDGQVAVTNAVSVKMTTANPGVFALGGSEPRAGLLLHAAESSPVTSEYPARNGEVLTVWATGLGAVLEDGTVAIPVIAQLEGQRVSVLSAKIAEHAAGVYEVQILIPQSWRGPHQAHLTIEQNGFRSNAVRFPLISPR